MTRKTHSKTAARALAKAEGITYQQALTRLTDVTAAIATAALDPDWAGMFVDGYTDDDIEAFFSHVYQQTGITLICLWDYFDEYGFGGNSDWVVLKQENDQNAFYELTGDLWTWMNEPLHAMQVDSPGEPTSWVGERLNMREQPQEWSGANWPWENKVETTCENLND